MPVLKHTVLQSIVCETSEGNYSMLLCSKTRIAQVKALSIPRLELMAARILVTLMDTVRKALSKETKIDNIGLIA